MALAPTHQTNIADIAAQESAERLERYQRAWRAYDGEGPAALEVEPGQPDDNIRLGYAKLIVNKGVSFLVGKDQGISVQVAPPDEDLEENDEGDGEQAAEEQAAEALALLDQAWPPHQRQVDFHKLATNGGVCGQAWLRIHEDARVSVLDPANCTAEWNEDDVEIVERYLIEWTTIDEDTGLGVMRRKRIEPNDSADPTSWVIYDEEHDDDAGVWRIIDETAWEHPYAPVITSQNLPSPNTFYGESDLECEILDQIEQLESVASDMRRIVRLHGHPVPVFFGEEPGRIATLDVAIGNMIAIPNKDGKLDQLTIAELESSLALFQELKTALFEATHIPKVALGETDSAGPTSGVALQVEYAPLVERTDTKRITYGYLIVEAAKRILDLLGFSKFEVTLGWPELLPSDPVSDAEADESELRMGIVSKRTIAEKRGYDWSLESERIGEETPSFEPGGLLTSPPTDPPFIP